MKISIDWLNEFVDLRGISAKDIAQGLSKTLTEVEDIESVGDDFCLTIENKAITHRPDCFSHIGIARECALIFNRRFLYIPSKKQLNFGNQSQLLFEVVLENTDICDRYSSVLVSNLKNFNTPAKMVKRLQALGVQTISGIVDLTNYVMLETGQPLHAFDFAKLSKIHTPVRIGVELLNKEQSFVTLDGKRRLLPSLTMVIINGHVPIAIAGIMGGFETEVDKDTTSILVESAHFNMHQVRESSMRLGLRTEASTRFEKGLDPEQTMLALDRFIELLNQNTNNPNVTVQNADIKGPLPLKPTIRLSDETIINKIGVPIKRSRVDAILAGLGVKVKQSGVDMTLTPPSYRADLRLAEDIMEEIIRHYGYDKLPRTLPMRSIASALLPLHYRMERLIKETLSASGLFEIYSYSFLGADLLKKCGLAANHLMRLQNPIAEDLKYLRQTLLPQLVEKVALNKNWGASFGFYEIGKSITPQGQALPQEELLLSMAYYNHKGVHQPASSVFYRLKGYLTLVFNRLGLTETDFELLPLDKDTLAPIAPLFDPLQSVQIYLSMANQKPILMGMIGLASSNLIQAYKLNPQLAFVEIKLQPLFDAARSLDIYHPIPKYQGIEEDITVSSKNNMVAEKIRDTILKCGAPYLAHITFIDFYQTSQEMAYTYHLTYRSNQKTLTNAEIAPIRQSIIHGLKAIEVGVKSEH